MKNAYRLLLTTLFVLFLSPAWAQQPEMADTMRANGKIYVVVGIVLIVLAGLIGYLVAIDRKVSRMERELSSKGK